MAASIRSAWGGDRPRFPRLRTPRGGARGLVLTVLACVVLLTACSNPLSGATGGTASGSRTASPGPQGTPATGNSLWILPALGLDVHAQPSLTAKRLITLACGTQVAVLGQRTVGSVQWAHVEAGGGKAEGWIVDQPRYVIDRAMSSYTLSGTLSLLYPTTWAVASGNPATFTAPSGDPIGGTLHLQSASDASALPNLPLAAGTEDTSAESSVSVDGIPSQVFVYLTSGGGTEYFIERKLGTLVYLIDLQQPASTADATFFLQLLTSVNAQFPATPTPSPS